MNTCHTLFFSKDNGYVKLTLVSKAYIINVPLRKTYMEKAVSDYI